MFIFALIIPLFFGVIYINNEEFFILPLSSLKMDTLGIMWAPQKPT